MDNLHAPNVNLHGIYDSSCKWFAFSSLEMKMTYFHKSLLNRMVIQLSIILINLNRDGLKTIISTKCLKFISSLMVLNSTAGGSVML